MIRVYIAAPYPIRTEAQRLAKAFDLSRPPDAEIVCCARWVTQDDELNAEYAAKDLADVARCDVFLALNPEEWEQAGTGGRHVELGYALALRKPILLVGRRSNIFHYLSDIAIAPDTTDINRAIETLYYESF